MNKKVTVNFSLSLIDFKIIRSEFYQPPAKLTIRSKGNFLINTNLDIDAKANNAHIYIDVKSNIFYRKKDKLLGRIKTKTTFKVKDLQKFVKDDKVLFPQLLMETLYSIAYSTTRGAFSTIANEIVGKNPIMPIVDIGKLLPPRVAI